MGEYYLMYRYLFNQLEINRLSYIVLLGVLYVYVYV